jgi:hypothetical protein
MSHGNDPNKPVQNPGTGAGTGTGTGGKGSEKGQETGKGTGTGTDKGTGPGTPVTPQDGDRPPQIRQILIGATTVDLMGGLMGDPMSVVGASIGSRVS